MKTSLAIATIALTFGAMLSFTSGVAAHFSDKSPGGVYPVQALLPSPPTSPPGPGPYRGNR